MCTLVSCIVVACYTRTPYTGEPTLLCKLDVKYNETFPVKEHQGLVPVRYNDSQSAECTGVPLCIIIIISPPFFPFST